MERLTGAIEKYKELSKEEDCLARTFRGFRDYGNPKSIITSEAENSQNLSEEYGQLAEWLEELKQFKDKQEQGLLIELPCKVGDKLYQIGKGWYQIGTDITEFTVTAITISKDRIIISVENENQMGFPVCIDCIGKRLFLTYSEAEEALVRMERE